jgi:hypothetical protein
MSIVGVIIREHLHWLTNYSLKKWSFYRILAFIVFTSKCCQTTVCPSSVHTRDFEWFTMSACLSGCLCLYSPDHSGLTSFNVRELTSFEPPRWTLLTFRDKRLWRQLINVLQAWGLNGFLPAVLNVSRDWVSISSSSLDRFNVFKRSMTHWLNVLFILTSR